MLLRVRSLLRVGAVAVAVISVALTAAMWSVVSIAAQLGGSADLVAGTDDDLATFVADTRDAVDAASSAIRETSELGRGIEGGSRQTADALETAGALIEGDVAQSLASVEDAMPALVDAGRVIDSTLSALTLFGVDYDPEVPFDEALVEVQDSMTGLPDEVRSQGREISALAPLVRTSADDTEDVVSSLTEVADELDDASATLGELERSAQNLDRVGAVFVGADRYRAWIAAALGVALAAGLVLSFVMWGMARLPAATFDAAETRTTG